MKAIKIENAWRVLLIESSDLREHSRRVHDRLEESLRGYLFSEIIIPSIIWEAFEDSAFKSEIDRLLRIGMRVRPDAKYYKLEEIPFQEPLKAALKANDFRNLHI